MPGSKLVRFAHVDDMGIFAIDQQRRLGRIDLVFAEDRANIGQSRPRPLITTIEISRIFWLINSIGIT